MSVVLFCIIGISIQSNGLYWMCLGTYAILKFCEEADKRYEKNRMDKRK